MEEPGRSYNSNTFRFGYTGHEKENDLAEGVYTTQYRLLDTRLGRWMSVDPLFAKYPDMSAYNYCGGNPVMLVDLKGDKIYIYMQKIKKIDRDKPYSKDCRVSYNKLKKMSMQEIGEKYGEFVKETFMALNILKGTKAFKDIFKNYNSRKYNLEIFYCGPNEDVHCSPGDDNTCCMQYNHRKADIGVITDENGSYLTVAMPPLSSILHEGAEFFKCNMTYGKKDNDYMLYEKEMDEGPEISKTGFKKNDSWNGQNDNYIMEYYETELARELYGLPGDKFYRNRHGGLVPYECTSATSIEPTEKGQEQLERLIKDKDLQK